MRHIAPVLAFAATTLWLQPALADPQASPVYAWCAAVSPTDNAVYVSEVFDAYGMERDISGQWYGQMQHHYANIDLTSARCFLFGKEMSRDSVTVDLDRFVNEMKGDKGDSMLKVDTHWTVIPYS